jgi:hypothetical protein
MIAPAALAALFSAHAALDLAPAPQDVPRLLLRIERARAGVLRFTLTNVAAIGATVKAQAYLVLIEPDVAGDLRPSYWSELDVSGLPTAAGPVRLAPRGRVAGEVSIAALHWRPHLADLVPDQPLARVVAPGTYRVQLQIKDDRRNWWRSNELSARVRPSGSIEF